MVGGWDRWRVVDLKQGVGGGAGGGYYLVVFACFFLVFVFFHLCFGRLFSHVLCPFVLSD